MTPPTSRRPAQSSNTASCSRHRGAWATRTLIFPRNSVRLRHWLVECHFAKQVVDSRTAHSIDCSCPEPATAGLPQARRNTASRIPRLTVMHRNVVYATPGACARLTCGQVLYPIRGQPSCLATWSGMDSARPALAGVLIASRGVRLTRIDTCPLLAAGAADCRPDER